MPRQRELINTSIVLVATKNNPAMLSADFIKDQDVFPSDFSIKQQIALPPLSQIQFENGYVFEAVENRIKLEYNLPSPIVVEASTELDDVLSEAARKLSSAVPYLGYAGVGLNFRFAVTALGLQNLTKGLPADVRTENVQFSLEFSGFRVQVVLSNGLIVKEQRPVVLADFNYHQDVADEKRNPERVQRIAGLLDLRLHCFARADKVINEIRF